MSTQNLKGTPLEILYTVFGVNGDGELCTKMTNIGLLYTAVVGVYSLLQPSPYGRYSKTVFGPTINAKLGWMVQECMSFFTPLILIFSTPSVHFGKLVNTVALSLFMLHYFQRSFIYPLTVSAEAKPAPVVVVLAALLFTTFNGFLQGHHLTNVFQEDSTSCRLCLGAGIAIFLTGMAINIGHDQLLISLRKNSRRNSDDRPVRGNAQKYKIPRGGLFEYISGANYFGEITEWIGLAVITRQYPQIAFAIFTTVFLGIRAIHHHRFYKENFGAAYPKSRKAIIPFVL